MLGQEYVPFRPLLLCRKVERRKAQLVHRQPLESMTPVCHDPRVVQRFPSTERRFGAPVRCCLAAGAILLNIQLTELCHSKMVTGVSGHSGAALTLLEGYAR